MGIFCIENADVVVRQTLSFVAAGFHFLILKKQIKDIIWREYRKNEINYKLHSIKPVISTWL